MVGLISLVIITGISGCIFWPVGEKDLIGTYQSVLEDETIGLPDGGTEVLELKPDGTCYQNIALKDGRKFSAEGTWKYNKALGSISFRGLHYAVGIDDKINPDIEQTAGFIRGPSVARNLAGKIIIGSREGVHYEKK